MELTPTTQEPTIKQLQEQVQWLTAQVVNLYARMQMPYAQLTTTATNQRTETGMGPIVSPEKTSFL